MNTASTTPGQTRAGATMQGGAASYGACPNCSRTLRVQARGCPHCRAIFDETSAWRVLPDPFRLPDEGTDMALAAEVIRPTQRKRAASAAAEPALSLAEQLLASHGEVVLENYAREYDPNACLEGSTLNLLCLGLLAVVLAPGIFAFKESLVMLLLTAPLALLLLFSVEAADMRQQVGRRKVVLDLNRRVLHIDHDMTGKSERYQRRVPLDDLRLSVQRISSSCEGSTSYSRQIVLQIPQHPSGHGTSSYQLLWANDSESAKVQATFDALLLHTRIPAADKPA